MSSDTRATQPNTIEHITIAKKRIPVTRHELAALEAALRDHIEAKGTAFGFVRSLLHGV